MLPMLEWGKVRQNRSYDLPEALRIFGVRHRDAIPGASFEGLFSR